MLTGVMDHLVLEWQDGLDGRAPLEGQRPQLRHPRRVQVADHAQHAWRGFGC